MTGGRGAARALAPLGLLACLSGCHHRQQPPAPAANPYYVVGAPWQGADGAWFYPREQPDYHATGLATIQPAPSSGLTADGERFDPDAMAASHQSLQLPCVLTVRNLENGRTILVRANDRGPAQQGRVLGLTPRAATLLGMADGLPVRVDITLDQVRSRTASEGTGGGPRLDIVAAPVEGVQEQPLPVPGHDVGGTIATGPAGDPERRPPATADGTADNRLPPIAQQGVADPGALWIDCGQFNRRSYADRIASELGASVGNAGQGREVVYTVREGPFQRTADADAALDRARRAGVTGARIIVE